MSAPAMAALAILGGVGLVAGDAGVTATTTAIKPEILELVNVIKQDLRKNNDDYVEHLPRLGAPRAAYLNITMRPPAAPASAAAPAQPHPPDGRPTSEDTRRRLNPMQAQNPRLFMNNLFSKAGLNARGQIRQKPDPRKLQSLAEKLKYQNFVKNNYPKKYMKKEKPDSLKTFIQKNKGKLQEFVNKKRQQAMMKAHMSGSDAGSGKDRLVFKLPSAENLDMAPALGGRIHSMRMKGRLCIRNVMFPEGPKYDSKGQIYLKAHGLDRKRIRLYDQTAPPKLVLPKCCNCCEKSVLGCE